MIKFLLYICTKAISPKVKNLSTSWVIAQLNSKLIYSCKYLYTGDPEISLDLEKM